MGKALVVIGLIVVAIGFVSMGLDKIGIKLFHLPGDINYSRNGVTVIFPIVTCILISLALTLLGRLFVK